LVGESSLPILPIQYPDYAYWQRTKLSKVLKSQEEYWCKQLADVPTLQLPFDRIRPPLESHRGNAIVFELDEKLSDKLRVFSKQQGATLFMTLMAAFQVLLSRYSGQRDFAVGTPIASRNHPQLENLIGCFINTLAIRADIKSEINFKTLVTNVKQTTLEAFSNQDLPFEKIVDALKLERNLSHAPIFQAMLVLNNKASFTKKATGRITFTCKQGLEVDKAIAKTIETGEGQTIWLNSVGVNSEGIQVSEFNFEWTLKVKS